MNEKLMKDILKELADHFEKQVEGMPEPLRSRVVKEHKRKLYKSVYERKSINIILAKLLADLTEKVEKLDCAGPSLMGKIIFQEEVLKILKAAKEGR